MGSSWYVTGTDTGIGKTVASCALLHALRTRGLRAVGMKPVASGCDRVDGKWKNDDALRLIAASDRQASYAVHNPFALPAATAPQLAARQAGIAVTLSPVLEAYRFLAHASDGVVVEGVGGWYAPLADDLEQSALCRSLELDVILVVGLRLGCLSHARLTARAIQADGLRLAGWIGNDMDPALAQADAYFQLLAPRLDAPCLGRVPFSSAPFDPRIAAHIDCAPLLDAEA